MLTEQQCGIHHWCEVKSQSARKDHGSKAETHEGLTVAMGLSTGEAIKYCLAGKRAALGPVEWSTKV